MEFSQTKIHKYLNITYGEDKFKLVKVVGKNMQFEQNPFMDEARSANLYNVLVFIIMDVEISEIKLQNIIGNF